MMTYFRCLESALCLICCTMLYLLFKHPDTISTINRLEALVSDHTTTASSTPHSSKTHSATTVIGQVSSIAPPPSLPTTNHMLPFTKPSNQSGATTTNKQNGAGGVTLVVTPAMTVETNGKLAGNDGNLEGETKMAGENGGKLLLDSNPQQQQQPAAVDDVLGSNSATRLAKSRDSGIMVDSSHTLHDLVTSSATGSSSTSSSQVCGGATWFPILLK